MNKRSENMLEIALQYLDIGWPVLAMEPGKKKPHHNWKKYQKELPTPEDVNRWFKKWPDAQVGIATGALSGVVVLDTDSPEAETALRAQVDIPETIWQITGRPEGGKQFFFCTNGHTIKNAAGIIENVDVRGDGGLVVLPPSIHKSGKRYQWGKINPLKHGLVNLADITPEIVEFIENSRPAGSKETAAGNEPDWVDVALLGVKKGKRNDTCKSLTGYYLRLFNNSVKETAKVLIPWDIHNDPPLGQARVLKTVKSIHQKRLSEENLKFVNTLLGIEIKNFIIRKYPDGAVVYEIEVSGVDGTIEFTVDDLYSSTRFAKRIIQIAEIVIPRFKVFEWDDVVQKLLKQGQIEWMTFDESALGVICGLIKYDIRRQFDDPEKMIHSQSVIYKDCIYLEMMALVGQLQGAKQHILAGNVRAIGRYLRKIGFEKNVFSIRGQYNGKRWKIPLAAFQMFIDEKDGTT